MKRIGNFLAFEKGELYSVSAARLWGSTRVSINHLGSYGYCTGRNGVEFLLLPTSERYRWARNDREALAKFDAAIAGLEVSPENLSTLLQMLQRVLVALDEKQEKS